MSARGNAMRTVSIITGSVEKITELKRFFEGVPDISFVQKGIDLVEIQELDTNRIMEHKLREAARQVRGEFLVDDTSLFLNALNGFPGPLIKWFKKAIKEEGAWELVKKYPDHRAFVRCTIGYGNTLTEPATFHIFEADVHGVIVEPKCKGYGFDTIFIPDGETKRYSEMTMDEKNACGHRGKAAAKVKAFLEKATYHKA